MAKPSLVVELMPRSGIRQIMAPALMVEDITNLPTHKRSGADQADRAGRLPARLDRTDEPD